MQISNVLTKNQDPSTLGQPAARSAAAPGGTNRAGGLPSQSVAANVAAAQVLSQYDVTNISPQQFSDMIQKLHMPARSAIRTCAT